MSLGATGHAHGVEVLKLSEQPTCALLDLRLEKRKPSLRKDQSFVNDVSKLLDHLALNSKFISNTPKRPRLSHKQDPKKPTSTANKSSKDSKELREVCRAPIPP